LQQTLEEQWIQMAYAANASDPMQVYAPMVGAIGEYFRTGHVLALIIYDDLS
jgi:F0F1-type ATP synthase alpha subunit